MKIYTFVSSVAGANTYCMICDAECLLIDAVCSDELIAFLSEQEVKKVTVLLTHGHYDHILGIPDLKNKFEVTIVSSEKGPEILGNAKKNLSAVAMLIGTLRGEKINISPVTVEADYILKDGESFIWNDNEFKTMYTPGHSPDSVCYLLEDKFIFVGDTLFQNEEPTLRFPGGNKEEYVNYTKPIIETLKDDLIVFPGHGDAFRISESIVRGVK